MVPKSAMARKFMGSRDTQWCGEERKPTGTRNPQGKKLSSLVAVSHSEKLTAWSEALSFDNGWSLQISMKVVW
ncbi:hypothetical protein TIFTF001_007701 [Ficus carica]|uniref:Uncharacterized protein n=1 Tax=Ficus carica TaxID=3494 RepID=A0AA88DGL3_FICCA|nr:hypothetical protein TIFTF001_007701 [Ficus carica]